MRDETVSHIHCSCWLGLQLPLWARSVLRLNYTRRLLETVTRISISFSFIHRLLVHQLWVVKTAGRLGVKRSLSCTSCSVCGDGQKIFLYRLIIQKKKEKKNVLKPVRKCLKELKREVLWTMLHLTYCSCMEPALKTVSRSFWLCLVNPSAQPNGHSEQQYLLLSLIHNVVALIWSIQCHTVSGGGENIWGT